MKFKKCMIFNESEVLHYDALFALYINKVKFNIQD